MAIKFIIDSASDFPLGELEENDIVLIPMKITFGDTSYLDIVELDHDTFYDKLLNSKHFPTTSQISPYEYEEVFEKIRADGDEAIVLAMSSKLSGTYQSAMIAAADFTDCIRVVDTLNASMGIHILIRHAIYLRASGMNIDELEKQLNEAKKRVRFLAMPNTLENLKKGGRVSTLAAFAGGVLSIKPIISVTDGEIQVPAKARGLKMGFSMIHELVEKQGSIDPELPHMMCYSDVPDIMNKYLETINEDVYKTASIAAVGSTVGTHIGPSAMGIAFFSAEK